MRLLRLYSNIDWVLLLSALILVVFGLVTINSYGDQNLLFTKQLLSLGVSLTAFFILSLFHFRFLKNSKVLMILYGLTCLVLVSLFIFGSVAGGARSWFNFGSFAFQPVDVAKVVILLVLAKYFAKRHMQIRDFSHILISGMYAGIIFLLVLVQPDFGSAMIIFFVWLGMVLIAGLDWRHLLGLFGAGVLVLALMWGFVFADYQKQRVLTFMDPTADLQGAGYNANQARIALGSGQLLGKGVGYGSQSRLQFLPESETDFIFSAFGEEWGFVGLLIVFVLFGIIIFRLVMIAIRGESNFEILFTGGVAIYLLAHFFIHVGINVGVMPVTGTTLPFMSYGGSHLLAEFSALGIVMGMRRHQRIAHKSDTQHEFLGAERVV